MLVFSLSCSLIQLKNLHWITETVCMINSPSFVLKKVQRYVGPWSKQNSYQISVQLNAKSSWFSFLYSNLPGFWPCDAFWFPVQHLLKLWNRDGSRAHPFCQVMVETQHLKQDKSKLNTRNTNTVTFKDNWTRQWCYSSPWRHCNGNRISTGVRLWISKRWRLHHGKNTPYNLSRVSNE